jgi:hypothetical protein
MDVDTHDDITSLSDLDTESEFDNYQGGLDLEETPDADEWTGYLLG